MAAPLFVTDEATLEERLRLTAIPTAALDAQAIIDEAILRARLRFYTELGAVRVTSLLAISFTDLPSTDDQVLRAIASTCEIKMVYCTLLRSLPNTFMDASGDVDKRWNEEAPMRERGGMELDDELLRCENEIVADLIKLAAPNDLACDEVQTFDGTADCPAPNVGLSLKGGARRIPSED